MALLKYWDDKISDWVPVGGMDAKVDVSDLITIGTSEDEKKATTPLFINTDEEDVGDNLADGKDLDDLWNN